MLCDHAWHKNSPGRIILHTRPITWRGHLRRPNYAALPSRIISSVTRPPSPPAAGDSRGVSRQTTVCALSEPLSSSRRNIADIAPGIARQIIVGTPDQQRTGRRDGMAPSSFVQPRSSATKSTSVNEYVVKGPTIRSLGFPFSTGQGFIVPSEAIFPLKARRSRVPPALCGLTQSWPAPAATHVWRHAGAAIPQPRYKLLQRSLAQQPIYAWNLLLMPRISISCIISLLYNNIILAPSQPGRAGPLGCP